MTSQLDFVTWYLPFVGQGIPSTANMPLFFAWNLGFCNQSVFAGSNMVDTVTGTVTSSPSKRYVQLQPAQPSAQNIKTFEHALQGGQPKPEFPTPEQYQEALSWSEGQSLESAKARMEFVRPLVEAIVPDIQGMGDNAVKAQQSWNNGQYLTSSNKCRRCVGRYGGKPSSLESSQGSRESR